MGMPVPWKSVFILKWPQIFRGPPMPYNLLSQIDVLVQERRNSRVVAMELRSSLITQWFIANWASSLDTWDKSSVNIESKYKNIFQNVCKMAGILFRHECVNGTEKKAYLITITHWGLDKMAVISQTTFWNTFSWMKLLKFSLKFHGSLFLMVKWTIFRHWFS